MARLPRGVQPTPAKERANASRAALRKAGGDRFTVDLQPEANRALQDIMAGEGVGKWKAIERALLAYRATARY